MAPVSLSSGIPSNSPAWLVQQIKAIVKIPVFLDFEGDDSQVHLIVQSRVPGLPSIIGPSGLRKLNLSDLEQGDQIKANLYHPKHTRMMPIMLAVDFACCTDLQLDDVRFSRFEKIFAGERKKLLLMLRGTKSIGPAELIAEIEIKNRADDVKKEREENAKILAARINREARAEIDAQAQASASRRQ